MLKNVEKATTDNSSAPREDTKLYHPFKESIDMLSEELIQTIEKFDCKRIVLTGGEPLLQQKDPELLKFLNCVNELGYYIETETNGTIVPNELFSASIKQWNVSPKLESSGNRAIMRENAAALSFFSNANTAWFKFVVCSENDIYGINDIVARYKIQKNKVLLMPEGTTREDVLRRSRFIVETCKASGYGFTPRLHILLWGSDRGR